MSRFAVINNDLVEHVVVADEVFPVQAMFSDYSTIIEVEDSHALVSVGDTFFEGSLIGPKPHDSWSPAVVDGTPQWTPPVAKPETSESEIAIWDEDSTSWKVIPKMPSEEPATGFGWQLDEVSNSWVQVAVESE